MSALSTCSFPSSSMAGNSPDGTYAISMHPSGRKYVMPMIWGRNVVGDSHSSKAGPCHTCWAGADRRHSKHCGCNFSHGACCFLCRKLFLGYAIRLVTGGANLTGVLWGLVTIAPTCNSYLLTHCALSTMLS